MFVNNILKKTKDACGRLWSGLRGRFPKQFEWIGSNKKTIIEAVLALLLVVLSVISVMNDSRRRQEGVIGADSLRGVWSVCSTPEKLCFLPERGGKNTATLIFDGFGTLTVEAAARQDGEGGSAPLKLGYRAGGGRLAIDGDASVSGEYLMAENDGVLLLGSASAPVFTLQRSGGGSGIEGEWRTAEGDAFFSFADEKMTLCAASASYSREELLSLAGYSGVNERDANEAFDSPQKNASLLDAVLDWRTAEFDGCDVFSRYSARGDELLLEIMLTVGCSASDGAVICDREYANGLWGNLDGCFFYTLEGDALFVTAARLLLIKE